MTCWLWNALKRPVFRATGLPAETLTTRSSPALHEFVCSVRTAADADAYWASIYERVPESDQVERLIVAPLRRRFCIGYEMPPWLTHLLLSRGIPFIDLRLHPVRFMDDLLFAARACCPEVQRSLGDLAVYENEVLVTAGLREAMSCLISDAKIPDNTLLVAGQRRFDSTQIVAGTFFDAVPCTAEIHRICAQYAAVVLKPHPLDMQHSLLAVAAAAPTQVIGIVSDNTYQLLGFPQIRGILTVNSSLATEAAYFDKQVHTLAPLPVTTAWRGAPFVPDSYLSLGDVVLTPDFWRVALAPYVAVTPTDGMRLPPKPNRLRIALDSFWNYHQIDTDRIPRSGYGTIR